MTQPAPRTPRTDLATVPCDERGNLVPRHGGDMEAMAQRFANSPLVPAKIKGNVDAVFTFMAMGAELGFSPAMSLQVIDAIEQRDQTVRLRISGEGYLAVMQREVAKLGEGGVEHGFSGKEFEDDYCAWVRTHRRGEKEPKLTTYSVLDAKRAKLWDRRKNRDGKEYDSNWQMYAKDMLFWKAVARHGRRCWADVMKGFSVREDLEDYAAERARDVTPRVVQLDLTGRPDLPAPAGLRELAPDPIFGSSDTYDVVANAGGDREQPVGETGGGVPEDAPPEEGASKVDASPAGSTDRGVEYDARLHDLLTAVEQRAEVLHEQLGMEVDVAEAGLRAYLRAQVKLEKGTQPTLEQIEQMLRLAPNATALLED